LAPGIKLVKLAVCILHNRDRGRISDELVKAGYKFTVVGSTGGFLKEGSSTFLIGVEEPELPALLAIIEQNCKAREQLVNVSTFEPTPPGGFLPNPIKVPVGGSVVFILDVEQFHRF
jgi:uncharacterized protein YaaQ